MFKNLTDCGKCVKSDVCSIKKQFNYATKEVAETNVIDYEHNGNRALLKAMDSQDVEVTIKCSKFMEIIQLAR